MSDRRMQPTPVAHGSKSPNSSAGRLLMPQRSPRQRVGVLSTLDRRHTIDKQIRHAGAVLMRLVVSRRVAKSPWVKDDNIGKVAGPEVSAFRQAQDISGQP